MPIKIVVGLDKMFIERNGVRSATVPIDGDVRAIAADLWRDIRGIVAFASWHSHRLRMAQQRADAAALGERFCHAGPRPDLIAAKPWGQARSGEWTIASHGAVARAIRQNKG